MQKREVECPSDFRARLEKLPYLIASKGNWEAELDVFGNEATLICTQGGPFSKIFGMGIQIECTFRTFDNKLLIIAKNNWLGANILSIIGLFIINFFIIIPICIGLQKAKKEERRVLSVVASEMSATSAIPSSSTPPATFR